jgi:hypothetical protein
MIPVSQHFNELRAYCCKTHAPVVKMTDTRAHCATRDPACRGDTTMVRDTDHLGARCGTGHQVDLGDGEALNTAPAHARAAWREAMAIADTKTARSVGRGTQRRPPCRPLSGPVWRIARGRTGGTEPTTDKVSRQSGPRHESGISVACHCSTRIGRRRVHVKRDRIVGRVFVPTLARRLAPSQMQIEARRAQCSAFDKTAASAEKLLESLGLVLAHIKEHGTSSADTHGEGIDATLEGQLTEERNHAVVRLAGKTKSAPAGCLSILLLTSRC